MFYHNWNETDPNNTGLSIADNITHSVLIWQLTQEIINNSAGLWINVVAGTPVIGGTFASTITAATTANTAGLHVTLAYTLDSANYADARLIRFEIGATNSVIVNFIDLKTAGGLGAGAAKWACLYHTSGGNSTANAVIWTRTSGGGNFLLGPLRFHLTMADDWIYMAFRTSPAGTLRGQAFIFLKESFPNNNINRNNFPGIGAYAANGTTVAYCGFYFPGRNGQFDGSRNAGTLTASGTTWVWGTLRAETGALPLQDLPDGAGEMVARLVGNSNANFHAEAVGFIGVMPACKIIRSGATSLYATITVEGKKYFMFNTITPVYGTNEASTWTIGVPVEPIV